MAYIIVLKIYDHVRDPTSIVIEIDTYNVVFRLSGSLRNILYFDPLCDEILK